MSSPQFFVDAIAAEFMLSPEDSRHALRSLRLRRGNEISVSDGAGTVGTGRISGERGGLAVVELVFSRRVRRPRPTISVALSPPSRERLSWAVQKLGEIGVDQVLLVEGERSVRRPTGGGSGRASARLGSIAREAAMQSHQPFVMDLAGWTDLESALAFDGQVIALSPSSSEGLSRVLRPDAAAIRLLIGPEGGFSSREIEAATSTGAQAASLGKPILRSETAAVASAVLALAGCGRLG